jgi:hypothetical protein
MQESKRPTFKKVAAAIAGSYVCIAFLALVVFDVGTRLTFDAWRIDKYNSPNRSAAWWATKDFRAQERPDVVLLGSSLMMAALHGGDATYLSTPQNVALHHNATYLEKLLSNKLHQPIKTFAFAIGGQMVSDAYAIASTVLRGDKKPDTIVYGVAPRDFMDNMLASPASTETFRYMSRLGGLRDVEMPSRATIWEKAELLLSKVSFLYDHRADFVYLQNRYTRGIVKHTLNMNDLEFVHAPFPLRKIALQQLPEDTAANEVMIMPYDAQRDKYDDNLPEYRMRYKQFNKKKFIAQINFLNRLGSYCNEEGIDLILVNMPLTPDNIALMPPGLYDSYMNTLRTAATKYGARVVDMQRPDVFTNAYFADSVHLNGNGGKLFFEQLAEQLANNSMLAVSRKSGIK